MPFKSVVFNPVYFFLRTEGAEIVIKAGMSVYAREGGDQKDFKSSHGGNG